MTNKILLPLFVLFLFGCDNRSKNNDTNFLPESGFLEGKTLDDHFVLWNGILDEDKSIQPTIELSSGTWRGLNQYEYLWEPAKHYMRFYNEVIVISERKIILTEKAVAPMGTHYKVFFQKKEML